MRLKILQNIHMTKERIHKLTAERILYYNRRKNIQL